VTHVLVKTMTNIALTYRAVRVPEPFDLRDRPTRMASRRRSTNLPTCDLPTLDLSQSSTCRIDAVPHPRRQEARLSRGILDGPSGGLVRPRRLMQEAICRISENVGMELRDAVTRRRSAVTNTALRGTALAFDVMLRCLPPPARGPALRALIGVLPSGPALSVAGRALGQLSPSEHLSVVAGPLAGTSWLPSAAVHECLAGNYEEANQRAFVRFIRPGDVVFDVGAHAGFFTLLASRLAGASGRVVAFEPFPENLAALREHLALNGVTNAHVIDAAVSLVPGFSSFMPDREKTKGKLQSDGELTVRVLSLDAVYASRIFPPPSFVKIDVEGEELNVLRGAAEMLTSEHPVIILATHGDEVHRACCDFLRSAGYSIRITWSEGTGDDSYRAELHAVPPSAD
jgi:FkbM family methyltransferase